MKRLVGMVLFMWLIVLSLSTASVVIIHVPGMQPTIQAGIDSASYRDMVLVADGIYTGEGNRDLDFKGKTITVTSENGPENCIIDCEGLGRAFYFHSGEMTDSVVSGFTITGGSSLGGYIGAICCVKSSPTIEYNVIVDNAAGGIYCKQGAPVIKNNTIRRNKSEVNGGGILCITSSPIIINNTVSNNETAGRGGGIICQDGSLAVIDNNIINENIARIAGGGISCRHSSPKINNNEISKNVSAQVAGGIALGYYSHPTITNCTIYQNSAGSTGGGIFIGNYATDPIVVLNTIIWQNLPEQIFVGAANWMDVTYSNIQRGWPGEGNIDANPLFMDPDNDNYRLSDDSPCIGTGFEEADMGAYPFTVNEPTIHTSVSIKTVHTIKKGNPFSAIIDLESVSNLAGFQFTISFDPTVLKATVVKEGTFLSDDGSTYWSEANIDNDAGLITNITCAKTAVGSISGSGILAIIEFEAIGSGETYIEVKNITLSDPNAEIIQTKITDCKVTVPGFPAWDVNDDGRVDVLDLVLVGQHLGKDIATLQDSDLDVNGDGTIDIFDIVLVGQHFGEAYSLTAPSTDMSDMRLEYLLVLQEIYRTMDQEINPTDEFLEVKQLISKLILRRGAEKTQVFQNFPNPFNPCTWIPFSLSQPAEPVIRIYNSVGRLVKTLDVGYRQPGLYLTKGRAVYWDGKNAVGGSVTSGVYFYTIQAGSYNATRKMIVVQ